MCEVMERAINMGIEQGRLLSILELVQSKDLSVEKATDKLGITVEELAAKMQECGLTFPS